MPPHNPGRGEKQGKRILILAGHRHLTTETRRFPNSLLLWAL